MSVGVRQPVKFNVRPTVPSPTRPPPRPCDYCGRPATDDATCPGCGAPTDHKKAPARK